MANFIPAAAGEEKLLQKRVAEAAVRAQSGVAWFSPFLSLREQQLATIAAEKGRAPYLYYGGFETAERKMLFVGPEVCGEETFPLVALCAEILSPITLTHRDFLGAILALGIKRSHVGDIVVGQKNATIYATKQAAHLIISELASVGRASVRVQEVTSTATGEMQTPENETASATVASLRADAVLAAVLHKSRTLAASAIAAGHVKVNDRVITQADYHMAENDYFTVKGHGKYSLLATGGQSRKNRTYITWKKH